MTPEEFRRIALSFPGTTESSHMEHPDFRVGGKIFATLWKGNGVLLLRPDQQALLVKSDPAIFAPVMGGWGRRGSTTVHLDAADGKSVRHGLSIALRNKAPKTQESIKSQSLTKKSAPKDVDSYIAGAPKEVRGKLKEIRAVIREVAPTAVEGISYGMPYYAYKGMLVWFAAARAHIGLYIPPPIIEQHKDELTSYGTSKSAVRLSLDEELPVALVKKLVRARMKWNESSKRSRVTKG